MRRGEMVTRIEKAELFDHVATMRAESGDENGARRAAYSADTMRASDEYVKRVGRSW